MINTHQLELFAAILFCTGCIPSSATPIEEAPPTAVGVRGAGEVEVLDTPSPTQPTTSQLLTRPNVLGEPMHFEASCDAGQERAVLGFVGDVLLHRRLQKQAQWRKGHYQSVFDQDITNVIALADFTYANLEGPVAKGIDREGNEVDDPGAKFDDVVYSSYPRFNYHAGILKALKSLGIDIVSTANNHALDRHGIGAELTIEALQKVGITHVGTRKRKSRSTPFYAVTEVNGITIGWVACTYGIGGPSDVDYQVRQCFRQREALVRDVRSVAKLSDLVIVTPHWGKEYEPLPRDEERAAARELLDAGASLVVASHPHVLQPWEKYITADGRETFVMHSLGNFVSNQREVERRTSVVLFVEVAKTANGVVLTGVRYVPIATMITNHRMHVMPLVMVEQAPQDWAHIVQTLGATNLSGPAELDFGPECSSRK